MREQRRQISNHPRVPEQLEIASRAATVALEAGALLREYFERGVETE